VTSFNLHTELNRTSVHEFDRYWSTGEQGSWVNGLKYLLDLCRVPSSADYTQSRLRCTTLAL